MNALFSSVPTQFGAVHLAILAGILLLSAGLVMLYCSVCSLFDPEVS